MNTLLFIILGFGVFIIVLGMVLLWLMSRQQKKLGVLGNKKPVYQDTEETPGDILYAKTLPLVGKPDYLIKEGKFLIPVEVKTGNAPKKQYLNHNMQLMAYCLLVEEVYGIRPPGGYLKYSDKELKLAYTKEAEQSVREVVSEIRKLKQSNKELHCSHPEHYY